MTTNPLGEAIVAAARDAFDKRRRSFVDVPAWQVDGPDGNKVAARIWFDPVSTEEYFALMNWRRDDGPHYAMVHTVVMKATDEAGARLFTAEHEIIFCKTADAAPILLVANAILGVQAQATVEKNS